MCAGPVLDARIRPLGSDHPHSIESLKTLGDLLVKTNRIEEAMRKFKEALERSERALGSDHPLTKVLGKQLSELQEPGKR